MTLILFPADSLERSQPDRDFQHEIEAAQAAGFETTIFDFDGFIRDEPPSQTLRRIREAASATTVIYRGWMLRPEEYERLYAGLQEKDYHLLNSPAQYRRCHYLPEAFPCLQRYTTRTLWLPKNDFLVDADVNFEIIHTRLQAFFGSSPILLKDYVKSQKHHWEEACFIPSAADREAVEKVTRRFLELQGSRLNGGLVYRAFLSLRPLTHHPKSGMPLTVEWRLFWLDGTPLLTAEYWEEAQFGGAPPPVDQFAPLAKCLDSRLLTMDVTQLDAGGWMVIETGDGQVSGLPTRELAAPFYIALAQQLCTEST